MAFKHPPLPSDDAPFDDLDNPEWTEADFARAKGPESLPPEVLAAFPKTQVNKGGRPRLARPWLCPRMPPVRRRSQRGMACAPWTKCCRTRW